MRYSEDNRAFASFSGICPYKCLHCYTFSEDFVSRGRDSVKNIIQDLSQKKFNIVYISGYKENFIDTAEGLNLIETIYNSFGCDILLTTRTVFDMDSTKRLIALNNKMHSTGNSLYFCESIPAYQSYKLLEPSNTIPSPEERIQFIKELYSNGISTIPTIRPLCPNEFIPISESLKIIEEINGCCSAIISSGIVVDEFILKRLKTFPTNFSYIKKNIMNCLNNKLEVKYVDVHKELNIISDLCNRYGIPFFQNSLPAINYINSNN